MSVGDMVTAPVAVASSDTSSCPSPLPTSGLSLGSALFLLEEREEEDPVILETVIRGDGLGDSFSLKETHKKPQSYYVVITSVIIYSKIFVLNLYN